MVGRWLQALESPGYAVTISYRLSHWPAGALYETKSSVPYYGLLLGFSKLLRLKEKLIHSVFVDTLMKNWSADMLLCLVLPWQELEITACPNKVKKPSVRFVYSLPWS